MINTKSTSEDKIETVIHEEERDGWTFVSATQTEAARTIIGEFFHRSFPATFLLFFRKSE
jgi:hypothetical protein